MAATVYEGAAEAVICAWAPASPTDDRRLSSRGVRGDETRTEDRERSARRARGRVRRYAVQNRLRWLVTLTYRPPQPTDPAIVLRDVQAFQRRLERAQPEVVWLRVFELHKSGALHVHLLSSGPHRGERRGRELAALWGHGFVDATDLGAGQGGARRAARYGSKYVGKGAVAGLGRHSYEVRQGHQPAATRLEADSWAAALRAVLVVMGGEVPSYVWTSDESADWRGPPVQFLSWEDG